MTASLWMLRYMPIGSHKGAEGSSCIFQWFIMVITMVMKLITRNGKEWMRRQTRVGIIIKWSERSEHGSSNTGANKADRADRANPTGQYWFDDTMGSGLNEGYHEWHSWGFVVWVSLLVLVLASICIYWYWYWGLQWFDNTMQPELRVSRVLVVSSPNSDQWPFIGGQD